MTIFYSLAFVCLTALVTANVHAAMAGDVSFSTSMFRNGGGEGSGEGAGEGSGESGGGTGKAVYQIVKQNCTISQEVSGVGEITIFGKVYKVTSVAAGAKFSKTWSEAARDCYANGGALCTPMSCGEFYLKLPSTL